MEGPWWWWGGPPEHVEGRGQAACFTPVSRVCAEPFRQATILNSRRFIFGVPECELGLMNPKL